VYPLLVNILSGGYTVIFGPRPRPLGLEREDFIEENAPVKIVDKI
jgi:hypothetical protein